MVVAEGTRLGGTLEALIQDQRVTIAHVVRPGEPFVFGHTGRPYGSKAFRAWLRLRCVSAGVPALSPHSARHTFASLAFDDGVPVQEDGEDYCRRHQLAEIF